MRLTVTLVLAMACIAIGGVAFGVNPIFPLPETYIGYKIGPFIPYLSLTFINHTGHINNVYEDYDEGD